MLNPYRVNELLDDPAFKKAAYALVTSCDELEQKMRDNTLTVREIQTIARYHDLNGSDVLDIFFYESLQERVAENIKRLNGEEYEEIEALALEAGLKPTLLYKKLVNMAPFDLDELDALCQALGVSLDVLTDHLK